jgi:hypothetical protein
MTNDELKNLWNESNAVIEQIEIKYRLGLGLTRQDCNELRRAVQRLGLVLKESWVVAGRPDLGPEFEWLNEPIPLSPLPASMRSQGNGSEVTH